MRRLRLREGQSLCRAPLPGPVRLHLCFSLPWYLGLGDPDPNSPHFQGAQRSDPSPRQPDNPLVAFSLLVFLALGHLPCLGGVQKHPDNSIFTGALQIPACPPPPPPAPAGSAALVASLAFRGHCSSRWGLRPATAAALTSPHQFFRTLLHSLVGAPSLRPGHCDSRTCHRWPAPGLREAALPAH